MKRSRLHLSDDSGDGISISALAGKHISIVFQMQRRWKYDRSTVLLSSRLKLKYKAKNKQRIKITSRLNIKEKEKHLSKEYGFETSTELEGGLKQMCNYSEWIEEKGIEIKDF